MNYLSNIQKFVELLVRSQKFHLLCISGAPGWAKTSTTRQTLTALVAPFEMLGSYTTPLGLYNHLFNFPNSITVMDDTFGLFSNPIAISILNAATWPGMSTSEKRIVSYTSTSELVAAPSFEFTGKIIVITNSFPSNPQTKAFLSRSLHIDLHITANSIGEHLLAAANSGYFSEQDTAIKVATYLGERSKLFRNSIDCPISLRTLEIGIEIARTNPLEWIELLGNMLPVRQSDTSSNHLSNSKNALVGLINSSIPVQQQVEEYIRITGKSRRSFFYEKKKNIFCDAK